MLEKVTNVAILALAILIGALIAKDRLFVPDPRDQHIGQTVSKIDTSRPTMILVLQKGCHYCEASTPFYQKLGGLPSVQSGKWRVVDSFPNKPEEAQTYVDMHLLPHSEIVNMMPPNMIAPTVMSTPTLLLAENGKVTRSWTGQLNSHLQDQVIYTLEPSRTPWWFRILEWFHRPRES